MREIRKSPTMKILSMSGFVPEHICDTVRFTQFSGDRNLSHYCGYASDFISQVIRDKRIDGAVYPRTCDSSRIITSYLSEAGKFTFQLYVPYRDAPGADVCLAASIRDYKGSVERYYGVTLPDVARRCEILNERNKKLAKVYEELENISYYRYITSLHEMLRLPLKEQAFFDLGKGAGHSAKRVFLVGSFLANTDIAKLIEDVGFVVVGDDLPESGRLISSKPVDPGADDLCLSIARSILSQRLSPSQAQFKEILEKDLREIKEKGAEAVIFISQKYCEPYDYLYSVYRRMLGDIPILRLGVHDTEDLGKIGLTLEAFADTLS